MESVNLNFTDTGPKKGFHPIVLTGICTKKLFEP
jgi:hypothetical protein